MRGHLGSEIAYAPYRCCAYPVTDSSRWLFIIDMNPPRVSSRPSIRGRLLTFSDIAQIISDSIASGIKKAYGEQMPAQRALVNIQAFEVEEHPVRRMENP